MSEPRSPMWNDDWLDRQRLIGDPPVDQMVAELVTQRGPEAARALFSKLITHLELPVEDLWPEARRFFETTGALPEWADRQQMDVAHRFFLDHGPKFLIFLFYKSLPTLYACAHGAKVLTRTGRLAHRPEDSFRIFNRRIAETAQFLLDVMRGDGLRPGGIGMRSAQKVRLIHASIRHFLQGPDWDTQKLGVPVNQEDMAITLMTFSVSMIEALEDNGIDVSDEAAEAYLHTWKVVGALMGLQPELLPATFEEGRHLLRVILSRQGGPSEDGKLLTQALVVFGKETIPTKIFDNAPEIFIRHFCGKEIAGYLGVKPRFGCLSWGLPGVIRKAFGLVETLEDVALPFNVLMGQVSYKLILGMIGYFNKEKQAYFHIPEEMQRAWEVKNPQNFTPNSPNI